MYRKGGVGRMKSVDVLDSMEAEIIGAAENNVKSKSKRLLQYDFLRIIACFSVIMLHSSSQFWYELPVTDKNWLVANSYDAMFRFGVPVFVMISGALFLAPGKEFHIKKLYTHNIFRLLTAYCIWSCAYGLWDSRSFDFSEAGVKPYLIEMMSGRYHLWFVPMLIGLYMLLPLLRVWTAHASKRELQYLIGLFLILQILKETAMVFLTSPNIKQLMESFTVEFVCSYGGYFVLGYYLAHVGIGQKAHRWIYAGGGAGLILAVVSGNLTSLRDGQPNGSAYDSFSLFTFMVSVAVFLFAVEVLGRRSFGNKTELLVKELSAATFGIYLMHLFMLEWLQGHGIHSMSVNILVGIPLLSILCFILCYILTALLRRIPFVGKYIC